MEPRPVTDQMLDGSTQAVDFILSTGGKIPELIGYLGVFFLCFVALGVVMGLISLITGDDDNG